MLKGSFDRSIHPSIRPSAHRLIVTLLGRSKKGCATEAFLPLRRRDFRSLACALFGRRLACIWPRRLLSHRLGLAEKRELTARLYFFPLTLLFVHLCADILFSSRAPYQIKSVSSKPPSLSIANPLRPLCACEQTQLAPQAAAQMSTDSRT